MNRNINSAWRPLAAAMTMALLISGAYSATAFGADIKVALSGANEVPPVTTAAKGSGTITVGMDGAVSGGVTTTGIAATAAHIHEAPAGKNGGVIVPMTKSGDNGWTIGVGAKLTEAQMASLKAGNLYVNVHSAAHPGGELRGQLAP
ncbi:MAG: CHRD domain-containing protein [Betaproteobacteria bacterium]